MTLNKKCCGNHHFLKSGGLYIKNLLHKPMTTRNFAPLQCTIKTVLDEWGRANGNVLSALLTSSYRPGSSIKDEGLKCFYHHHLPEKIRNTFFLAQVVNAFFVAFLICGYLVCWGPVGTTKCFSCFIHCCLQMCSLVFVNDSFFWWSRENLQIIMVYIPEQNRIKMQIA